MLGARSGELAVAVRPYERLLSSPLLTRAGTQAWQPDELPGAVADSPAALALSARGSTVLLEHWQRRPVDRWVLEHRGPRLRSWLVR